MSTALNTISPRPIITRVVQSWRVLPGMIFAVAEDAEKHVWIVESTPVGTHCWTVAQAMELPQGARTRRALREAIRLGRQLQAQAATAAAESLTIPDMLPRFAADDIVPAHTTGDFVSAQQPARSSRCRQPKEPACV